MIELTPEQRQAVEQGEPVRVVDPATHDAYVLMRAEVFERMAGVPQAPEHEPPANIDPRTFRSMQAFWRDLPGLLGDKRHQGRWVTYRGDEQIAFGRTQAATYQECFRRGLLRGEFYAGKIVTAPDGIPPWGTFEIEGTLCECTDRGEAPVPSNDA
jgi:hypothetical protein